MAAASAATISLGRLAHRQATDAVAVEAHLDQRGGVLGPQVGLGAALDDPEEELVGP